MESREKHEGPARDRSARASASRPASRDPWRALERPSFFLYIQYTVLEITQCVS